MRPDSHPEVPIRSADRLVRIAHVSGDGLTAITLIEPSFQPLSLLSLDVAFAMSLDPGTRNLLLRVRMSGTNLEHVDVGLDFIAGAGSLIHMVRGVVAGRYGALSVVWVGFTCVVIPAGCSLEMLTLGGFAGDVVGPFTGYAVRLLSSESDRLLAGV